MADASGRYPARIHCTWPGCPNLSIEDDRCADHHLDHCGCPHAHQEHIMWVMWDDGDPIPVPAQGRYDNHLDAAEAVARVRGNPVCLWARAFRSDNESYECIPAHDPTETA